MIAIRKSWMLAILISCVPTSAFASKILLLTAGDSATDAAIASTLQSQGDSVTVGPTFSNFTGSGLSNYNEVMVIPGDGAAGYSSPDMPTSGQQALVDFVKAGGGLVTGESLVTMASNPGGPLYPKDFQTLAAAIPVQLNTIETSNTGITFTSLTKDPVITAGLPSSFSFTASSNTFDTETFFAPKAGATPLFATNQWTTSFGGEGIGYGAIAWSFGNGRVFSLSTGSDLNELADPNYAQLLRNASNWVTDSGAAAGGGGTVTSAPSPVPEPTTFALIFLGCAGFLATRRAAKG